MNIIVWLFIFLFQSMFTVCSVKKTQDLFKELNTSEKFVCKYVYNFFRKITFWPNVHNFFCFSFS